MDIIGYWGSDNINNSYYFYDEILSSDFDQDIQGKFKILNVLFALTLQLKHFPEAQELLEQIKGLGVVDANFIANQITFDQLQNDGANTAVVERVETIGRFTSC